MTSRRRRRGTSPAAPPSLLEDEDLLMEILLRLPREPSALLRASTVRKQWGCLAADPKFLARFRAHHGKPPLLGVFEVGHEIKFRSVLDPPDRIPPERFSLGRRYSNPRHTKVLACRHGRVLVKDRMRGEVVVCDPITSKQHSVSIPPQFNEPYHKLHGTVLCANGDQGHVHGSCHSCPFKVVLVSEHMARYLMACVYFSETGIWGDIISIEALHHMFERSPTPSTLVGNVLYWPSTYGRDNILQFDLDSQILTLIKGPRCLNNGLIRDFQIIQTEDGVVGLVVLTCHNLQIWQRKVNRMGVAIWLRQKTVALHNILELPPKIRKKRKLYGKFVGHDEDNDAMLLYMYGNVYMVQLKSMQSKKLKAISSASYCYPFTSFYPPGTITAEYGGEMLG